MNKVQIMDDDEPRSANLRSISECLTPRMTEACLEISEETRLKSLAELEAIIKPDAVLSQVKISFWDQYERVIADGRKTIEVATVVDGITNREFFYTNIVRKELVLMWMLHPPTDYDRAAREALSYGIPKIREMLEVPLFKVNADGSRGDFLNNNAASVLNAMKFLDARVKGSPLQRIEQKSMHLHKNMDGGNMGISREEMRQELESLGQRLGGNVPLMIKAPDETE